MSLNFLSGFLLQVQWTQKKLTDYLKKMEEIQIIKKGRANQYTLKDILSKQVTLFG